MFNKKLFEYGGIAASIVLIVFGVGAIALGLNGRSTVRDSLKLEQIVGTPDMTRDAIAAEAKKAGATVYFADEAYRRYFRPYFWKRAAYGLGALRPPRRSTRMGSR